MSENSSTYNSGVQLYDYNNLPIYPRVNVENISFNEYDPSIPMSEFINIHVASCDKIELLNNIDINNDTNGLHINAVDVDKKISSNMRLAYVNSENETIEYALKNDIGEVDLSHIESSINSLDASVKTLNASVNSINSNFNNYYTSSEIDGKNYATEAYVDEEIAKIDVGGGDIPDDVVTRDELNAYATKNYVDGSIAALNNSIDNKVNEAVSKIEISEEIIQDAISNSSVIEGAVADVIGNEYATKNEVSTGLANKVDKDGAKGLSTNDFTNELKTKLEGIATGAEVNVVKGVETSDTNSGLILDASGILKFNLPGFSNALSHNIDDGTVLIPGNSNLRHVTFIRPKGDDEEDYDNNKAVIINNPISGTVEAASGIDASNIIHDNNEKYLPIFVNNTSGHKAYKSNHGSIGDNEVDCSLYLSYNDGQSGYDGKWHLHTPNITCHNSLSVTGNTTTSSLKVGKDVSIANNIKIDSSGITLGDNTKISMGDKITLDSSNSGYVTATEFYKSSDERLKNFSNDISIDFDALRNIPKKYFTWKSDELNKPHIGTSAQELMKVYPELVNRDENDMLSVDYSTLSIIALKAIDILVDRIEKLENELDGR